MEKDRRPNSILVSQRANVMYLERCRVMQKDETVVYYAEEGSGDEDRFFNIPDRNTLFVLLGPGTSITNAAMRKLAESSVVVGFCGTGGTPLHGITDSTFILPQDEYRPTEYMQSWMALWQDEQARLEAGRQLLTKRAEWCERTYRELSREGVSITPGDRLLDTFEDAVEDACSTTDLLSAEAEWAKQIYAHLAKCYEVDGFRRVAGNEGRGKNDAVETINGLLDHGNYLAYGYASVVLHTLGIPFSMPILHGKTRRGGLVFDVADLIKDSVVMPHAFRIGRKGYQSGCHKSLRDAVVHQAHEDRFVGRMFDFVKEVAAIPGK
ncbi:type I-F CRISPR-associated endonuclease Cas1f [Thioalkalivibrio sp. ALE19]|uniref:type I-F CRISPR-associated endonuclease Cas1f n=1 Tax=Thioalkalivibrio sp. ALE19 TaxID=1266909 RepID=UPI000416C61E|nr:type I-F CRISPR-associated endonuclease Cas1f [Thioalkalivibrio sp. ALE19]